MPHLAALLLITTICTGLISCNKKGDTTPVEGKWNLFRSEHKEWRDGRNTQYSKKYEALTYFVFNTDNTFVGQSDGDDKVGFWKLDGDNLQIRYDSYGTHNFKILTVNAESLVMFFKHDLGGDDYNEETYYFRK